LSAVAVAVAGLVALAVAMGIGRFAFTPILPMMLHDGVVDLHAASWLASANYLGYLSGAVLCTLQPRIWALWPALPAVTAPSMTRIGLVATIVLTLGMALPAPLAWPVLRFAAGIASALVFVYSSGWCLTQIAARGQAALGGLMFAGPGIGIVASGLLASAMVGLRWPSSAAWEVFAALALILTATVWRVFRDRSVPAVPGGHRAASTSATTASRAPTTPGTGRQADHAHAFAEVATLAAAYGLSGFGYIVTATFLPVIARGALPGSTWLDLFWPIFGVGVILGAVLATRVRVSGDLRLVLAAAYAIQALGIGIGIAWPTEAGFALGSFLLGFPFTAITYFAMQEVRRLRPHQLAGTTGLVTATWSTGQTLGPPMVALLLHRGGDVASAFTLSLVIAAAALAVGGLVFLAASRMWPKDAQRYGVSRAL
jgi:MFS family permease